MNNTKGGADVRERGKAVYIDESLTDESSTKVGVEDGENQKRFKTVLGVLRKLII